MTVGAGRVERVFTAGSAVVGGPAAVAVVRSRGLVQGEAR